MQPQYSFQTDFRPELLPVKGCVDYRRLHEQLQTIDDLLLRSGLDQIMISLALEERRKKISEADDRLCDLNKFLKHALIAWRTRLLIPFLDSSAPRKVAKKLADSPLCQWFCFISNFEEINPPSKSTVARYKKAYTQEQLHQAFCLLLQQSAQNELAYDENLDACVNLLGFEVPSDLREAWFDSTCLKPNIHFPVDWVLLIDVVKTLAKATIILRNAGVKNRMPKGGPDQFLRRVSQISISMGNTRRQKGGKKKRKKIFRSLDKLVKVMAQHAQTHRDILKQSPALFDLSPGRAKQVIQRIDYVLEKLPQARLQARERIIGERKVKNDDKLLSLYEPDTRVIIRGKSGAEIEYGNKLMLVENREGLITHWELYNKTKTDTELLVETVKQTEANIGISLTLICGDRGFSSEKEQETLSSENPKRKDHITLKSVPALKEAMKDEEYRTSQKRRAQTEGRVAIIKNCYMPGRSLSKGLDSRRLDLSWIMLAHNLRKLAERRIREKEAREALRQENSAKAS
ncbi:MAG: hypothetical protein L3J39_06765 [Verrucomicrobiales bacterium]|nr:hypothetical protein [Verrucomicrobiales bacterium]